MKNCGKWIREQYGKLRNWREIAKQASKAIREVIPCCEVYVFGSIVEGKVTGASDIDVLVVIGGEVDILQLRRLWISLNEKLEEILGENAYIIDLHLISRDMVEKPPYKQWLEKAKALNPS